MAVHTEHAHNDLANPASLRDHILDHHRRIDQDVLEFDSTEGMRHWHEQQHARQYDGDHLSRMGWTDKNELNEHLNKQHRIEGTITGWIEMENQHRQAHADEDRLAEKALQGIIAMRQGAYDELCEIETLVSERRFADALVVFGRTLDGLLATSQVLAETAHILDLDNVKAHILRAHGIPT